MLLLLRRLLTVWAILARYRIDCVIKGQVPFSIRLLKLVIFLHPRAWFSRYKNHPMALRFAFEDLGVIAIKIGQLLSTRHDLLPNHVTYPLSFLQDKVRPFDSAILKAEVERAVAMPLTQYFSQFDELPLAAASIAQVHTGVLSTGQAVVIKVVRPNLAQQIANDFTIISTLITWLEPKLAFFKAIHAQQVLADYRKTLLGELDLRREAANTRKFRQNFLHSSMMYVPEVFFDSKNVMIAERIYGIPVTNIDAMIAANVDRAKLAENGLTTFFTQVFRDNFFHADMHAGNVFVDISNPSAPKFISLDCAIAGSLTEHDRMTVARLLLAVMQQQFGQLISIADHAGWIPAGTDLVGLTQDVQLIVSPMIEKPMSELDFAGILMQIMDMARTYQLQVPSQLILLLKTLVHVEGLGSDLYPDLDIWKLAKPILSGWIQHKMHPKNLLNQLRTQAPDLLLGAADLPNLVVDGLNSLKAQPLLLQQLQAQHSADLRLLQRQLTRQRKTDWLVLGGVAVAACMAMGTTWLLPTLIIATVLLRMVL